MYVCTNSSGSFHFLNSLNFRPFVNITVVTWVARDCQPEVKKKKEKKSGLALPLGQVSQTGLKLSQD